MSQGRRLALARLSSSCLANLSSWNIWFAIKATLPVASVHEVRDGRITRWCDYWDMNVLVAAAPPWWFEHVLLGWK